MFSLTLGVRHWTKPIPSTNLCLNLHRSCYTFWSHTLIKAGMFYTSIPLAQTLKSRGTTFTGTVIKNRADLPNEIRGRLQLGSGEVTAFRDGDLLALAWRAARKKKPVIMLSTECSARSVAVAARQSGSEPQTKPVVVHTYNQQMNGVDIADQHAVYYSFLRKTVKWWRKLFFLAYRDSSGEQLCSLQLYFDPKKTQPPGLPACSSRESCHQVSCLWSTSLSNWMSTQTPTSWAIRATEAKSSASPHRQSHPVTRLCCLQW